MSVEKQIQELEELAGQLDEMKDKSSQIELDSDDEDDEDDKMKYDKKEVKEAAEQNEDLEELIDLGGLFDGETISEEFKLKATAIFEAAVAARVKQEVAVFAEEFEQQSITESAEIRESLVDKVDGYLDFMVEQWMEKNELAIERGIKTEILESFVLGMKGVFESHYIDVPDEKYDLVEAAQSEAAELEERLNESVAENVKLKQVLRDVNRSVQIEEACDGLAATDADKFRQLAEELSYSGEEEFGKKLVAIKENYFKTASKDVEEVAKPLQEEFMTDIPVEVITEEVKIDPMMARYLAALERR